MIFLVIMFSTSQMVEKVDFFIFDLNSNIRIKYLFEPRNVHFCLYFFSWDWLLWLLFLRYLNFRFFYFDFFFLFFLLSHYRLDNFWLSLLLWFWLLLDFGLFFRGFDWLFLYFWLFWLNHRLRDLFLLFDLFLFFFLLCILHFAW